MTHTCHAWRCNKRTHPSKFMCSHHWSLVPQELKDEIWKHYRKGQEKDKQPSQEYVKATIKAKKAVAQQEGFL